MGVFFTSSCATNSVLSPAPRCRNSDSVCVCYIERERDIEGDTHCPGIGDWARRGTFGERLGHVRGTSGMSGHVQGTISHDFPRFPGVRDTKIQQKTQLKM